VEKKEFYTEGAESTEFTEKRKQEKRSETQRHRGRRAEKKKRIPRFARNDSWVKLRRRRKGYGGKLKDLSLVSTQTLTTLVFWAFSGSLLAMGMGLKGLMATRTSTLVLEPSGDLALRML